MSKNEDEMIYTVNKTSKGYLIGNVEARTRVEELNMLHITTICLPYIVDGKNKGKIVVHNRYQKNVVKLLFSPKPESKILLDCLLNRKVKTIINATGGHLSADAKHGICGLSVYDPLVKDLLLDGVLKESDEELLVDVEKSGNPNKKLKIRSLEIWDDDKQVGTKSAVPYHVPREKLVEVGFVEYDGASNKEVSMLYTFPMTTQDYDTIVAADNYKDIQGKEHDIYLPICLASRDQLQCMKDYSASDPLANSDEPVREDAIARLFMTNPVNKQTFKKLCTIIP
jgi:hypothetical protein